MEHCAALPHGGIDPGNKAIQICNDLVFFHESVRIIAGIRIAGKITLPVGRHQAKGIPALIAPGVSQAVLFQHNMINVVLLQVVAGR